MSGVWPFEVTVEDTDFVQNQATFAQHDMYGWYEYEGAQPWAGRSSYVLRSSHYEGGFELEGLVAMCPSFFVELLASDSPNSVMDVTYENNTFVDHGGLVWGIVISAHIWPPPSDQARQLNWHLVDVELSGNTALSQGDVLDSAWAQPTGCTHILVERSRFANNVNADSTALGTGGFALYTGQSQKENRPHARFINVEWLGNSAGSGPAVGLVGGVVDASFDTCVMRSNVAYLVRAPDLPCLLVANQRCATAREVGRSRSTARRPTGC